MPKDRRPQEGSEKKPVFRLKGSRVKQLIDTEGVADEDRRQELKELRIADAFKEARS